MPISDEYQLAINEGQRRLVVHALTTAMASDRLSSKGGVLTTYHEYMELIRLFSTVEPSMRQAMP
jgi:hypothetical protein